MMQDGGALAYLVPDYMPWPLSKHDAQEVV